MADRCSQCTWVELTNQVNGTEVKSYAIETICPACQEQMEADAAQAEKLSRWDFINDSLLNDELLAALGMDFSLLPYWAVIGGLIKDRKFAALNQTIAALQYGAGIQDAVIITFKNVLKAHGTGIDLDNLPQD